MWRPHYVCLLFSLCLLSGCGAPSGPKLIRIPKGAGGVGFLPLLVIEKNHLLEKYAKETGAGDIRVQWIDLGGPAVMNDALLSGSAEFASAGPPAFLTLWDKTNGAVKGLAAMTSLPMYLNTRVESIH